MRKKLKPNLDLEFIQSDLIETVCFNYKNGVSVRSLAKQFDLSPMKTRKILITGGVYSTDLSTEIGELWKDGKTVGEIAELLDTTTANVNSYLPYERIIYKMSERSVEADRQARYRERKKEGVKQPAPQMPEKKKVERRRTKTMIILAGFKLRRALPKGIYDNTSDPLARYIPVEDPWNPPDPDRMIWCAELVTNGKGKKKKQAIVLESAFSGFAVICPLPPAPDLEQEDPEELKEYRTRLEIIMLDAIREGLLSFALPQDKVLDYTDTIRNIELIKAKPSMPSARVEELIEQELVWKSPDDDPLEHFNIRGNWTSRKFGHSPWYRSVDAAVCTMLQMDKEECQEWMEDFLKAKKES